MLRRLRRPGYWIVLLAVMTVYFYHGYQVRQREQQRQALFRLYRSYGETVMTSLREGNLSGLQHLFGRQTNRKIALEDIAMFVATLHLDHGPRSRWKSWEEKENNVTLHGELSLEGNVSYPIDVMMVKQGKRFLLNCLRVGPKTLELRPVQFPMNTGNGGNTTRPISGGR